MKLTFLGTGTSHGIPVLTCSCNVCTSDREKNRRLRSSVYIESETTKLLIDTTPEFRIQGIKHNITQIDAIFYTHTHADHLHGIDDIRPYSVKKSIPLYGLPENMLEIKERFPYIFGETVQKGGGKPNLIPHEIFEPVTIGDLNITPIPLKHGVLDIYGYRINNIAYLTDCSGIPVESYTLLKDLDILIIGALRYTEHSTHYSIDQAIEQIEKIKPKRAYLTHLSHALDHYTLEEELIKKELLIKKIKPAHDGLCLKSD
ncbi:MAG: MBL fold metallo-hydrolase [Spirochaetaceae bacterium]